MVSQTYLVFDGDGSFEECEGTLQIAYVLEFIWCFLSWLERLRVLGRKITNVKCHFHHNISRVHIHIIKMIITVAVDFVHLAEAVGFTTVKLLFLPPLPSYRTLWKETTVYSLHLKSEEFCPSLKIKYLYGIWNASAREIYFSSHLLFIQ